MIGNELDAVIGAAIVHDQNLVLPAIAGDGFNHPRQTFLEQMLAVPIQYLDGGGEPRVRRVACEPARPASPALRAEDSKTAGRAEAAPNSFLPVLERTRKRRPGIRFFRTRLTIRNGIATRSANKRAAATTTSSGNSNRSHGSI